MTTDWQTIYLVNNDNAPYLENVLYGVLDYTFTEPTTNDPELIVITWKISFYNSSGKEVYVEIMQSKFCFHYLDAIVSIDQAIHRDFLDLKRCLFQFLWESQERLLKADERLQLHIKVNSIAIEIMEKIILCI